MSGLVQPQVWGRTGCQGRIWEASNYTLSVQCYDAILCDDATGLMVCATRLHMDRGMV
jgi:hypothetical protein